VNSVDFSADGASIATGGIEGDAKLWSAASGQEDVTLANAGCDRRDCRASVAFDPAAKRIAVAGGDRIWLHDLDFVHVQQQAVEALKRSPNIQENCRRLLHDSCPGF
jgi:hypothetical protein